MLTEEVQIVLEDVTLDGNLVIPDSPKGLVIFSHGSGSSRFSPRNNYVARLLQQNGMATLLFDLLTRSEDLIYENRFDIDKLTQRLIETTQWVRRQKGLQDLAIGYFGASTGAASALRGAAFFGNGIQAVVSRGGRPDLALEELHRVEAPTLLLVGSFDTEVIRLNQKAYDKLQCQKKMEIIPGASHLFEEPGKLREAANVAADWFEKWFDQK
ncbi:MAG: alpha/beta family hydrolase [Allomuricauda sp.]